MTNKTPLALTVLLACAVLADPVSAAVLSAAPSGFVVKHEIEIAATPAKVYATLLQIGRWWNPEHSFSGSAANFSIDAKAGGCWCEKLPSGGSVRLGLVEYVDPGKLIRFTGMLGPLQAMGGAGMLSFELSGDKTTRLVLTNIVSGYAPGKGFGEIAAPVDGVLGEQVQRLKRFMETGKP